MHKALIARYKNAAECQDTLAVECNTSLEPYSMLAVQCKTPIEPYNMHAVEDFTKALEHTCSGSAKTLSSCFHTNAQQVSTCYRAYQDHLFHLLSVNSIAYLDAFLVMVAADFLQFEGKASKS